MNIIEYMLLQAPPTAPNTVFYLSLTLRSLAMQLTDTKEQPWEKVESMYSTYRSYHSVGAHQTIAIDMTINLLHKECRGAYSAISGYVRGGGVEVIFKGIFYLKGRNREST